MRDIFHGYYSLSQEEEIKKFWKSCVFVFDANVLLDLFRLSRKSTDRLLKIMESQKERIWLPYQVAEEYHRNLSATISEQAKKCEKTILLLENLLKELGIKKNQSFHFEIIFLPHENYFSSAQKFISFRTKIYSLPNETKYPHIIIGIGSCQLLDY